MEKLEILSDATEKSRMYVGLCVSLRVCATHGYFVGIDIARGADLIVILRAIFKELQSSNRCRINEG